MPSNYPFLTTAILSLAVDPFQGVRSAVVGMLRGLSQRTDGGTGQHALLVGHLNWHTGETAVFERLDEVEVGDTIILEGIGEGADGQTAYLVTSVRDVDAFATPIEDVLGSGARDTITLITCSGEFLWNVGAYSERRIVSAVLVEV